MKSGVALVPILSRKFVPPALPAAYLRREDAVGALENARIATVWGGPGYGKSLLLADAFARSVSAAGLRGGPAGVWLSLESADSSPFVFLSHLVAGVEQALPSLSALPGEQLASADPEFAAEPVLARLTEEVAELCANLLVVLDGADVLPSEVVERLVEYWPGRLWISARGRPDLVADLEIGPEQLRFSVDQTAGLVRLAGGDPAIGTALHERTAGWPAGVSMGARADVAALHADEPLHEYISHQVLYDLPADAREDLLACALLPGGAAALIPLLTAPEALGQLDALAAQGFLLSKGPDGYVFHPLFKAALQDAAARTWPAERLRAFHLGVASAIVKDDPEAAVDHWLAAGAWAEAEARIVQLADGMLGQGRSAGVQRWLDRIPGSWREGSCRVALLEGEIARHAGKMAEAQACYDRAGILAKAVGDARSAVWALALSAAAGKGAMAAQAALDMAPADDLGLKAFAYDQLGLHHLREGDLGPAATYLGESASLYRRVGDAGGLARVSTHLGRVLATGGQFERALAALDEARAAARGAGRIPPAEAGAAAARVRATRGETTAAWELAEQAVAEARQVGDGLAETEALAALGHIGRITGQFQQAQTLLAEAAALAGQLADPVLFSMAQIDRAELALAQAHSAEARGFLDEARSFRQSLRVHHEGDRRRSQTSSLAGGAVGAAAAAGGRRLSDTPPAESLAEIAVALSEGALEGADAALGELIPVLDRRDLRYDLTRARFLQARLLSAQGKAERAREAAESARKLARQYQFSWLETSEDGRIAAARAPDLALEGSLFGRMRVKVDGKQVAQSAWRAAKAKLLLAHLLTSRHGSGKEELVEIFFAGDTKASALHVLIARLRAALEPGLERNASSRFILFQDGRYRFNFALRHRIDTADFSFQVGQARQSEGAERQLHLRQALDLYGGPFLVEFEEPWVEAERERFRRDASWVFLELSQALEAAGQHGAVLDLADRQIQLDRTAQEAHRAKMRALGRMGRREDALKHFKLVERIMKQEIGIGPDSETIELHLQILRGSLK